VVASEALISEVTIRDQASAAADRISSAMKRMADAEGAAGEVTARTGRAIETAGRSFERLKAAVDPVYAANQRLAQTQLQLNRAVELGVASQAEATALMQRHIVAANNAARGGVAGFNTLGSAIQQAGFQVGDFAVQVASGSGVLRPLIQQGTQLVSMFGPWGAVLGAAAATLGALVPLMWSWAASADTATASHEKLVEVLKEMDKLQKEIEGNTKRNRASIQAELNYDLEQVQKSYDAAKAALSRTPKTVTDPNNPEGVVANPDYGPVHDYYVKLEADLQTAKQAAGQFSDSFARAGIDTVTGSASSAKSIRAVTDAMEEQLRVLRLNKQEREADKIVDRALADLNIARAGANKDLLATLTDLAEKQVAQAEANKAAEDAQRKSAENAKAVAGALAGLQKQYDDLTRASLDVRAADLFAGKVPSEADLARARELLKMIDEERTHQAADKAFQQEIDQLIEQGTRGVQQRQQWFQNGLQTQAAQIALMEKELELGSANDNDAQLALAHLKAQQEVHTQIGAGLDVNAQKYIANADAIALLNQQLARQRNIAQELPQFFDQAFDRIGSSITQAMATGEVSMASLADVARAVVSEIEQEFIKLALLNPLKNWIAGNDNLPSIFNLFSLGGFSAGALGSVNAVTGLLGHAANGGYIEVGEKGPERFYPNVSGTVVPNGGGSGPVTIVSNVTLNASGGSKEQNADLASQASAAVKQALKQAINDQTRENLRKGNLLNPSVSVG